MANAAYKTHSHGACADFPSIRKILVNWLVEVPPSLALTHVPGGGRPLLREGGPITYKARPSAFFSPSPSCAGLSTCTATALHARLPHLYQTNMSNL